MFPKYTISVRLTDGTSEPVEGLTYWRHDQAVRAARHLAGNPFADAAAYCVDDADGWCVFSRLVRRK